MSGAESKAVTDQARMGAAGMAKRRAIVAKALARNFRNQAKQVPAMLVSHTTAIAHQSLVDLTDQVQQWGEGKVSAVDVRASILAALPRFTDWGTTDKTLEYASRVMTVFSLSEVSGNLQALPQLSTSKKKARVPALPPLPGTAPIPAGTVRLYHQTPAKFADAIQKEGIMTSKARIAEEHAIFAGETGFYFKPGEEYDGQCTVEFYVPKDQWQAPNIVLGDVPPENIIAAHQNWHARARYLEDPANGILEGVLAGEYDDYAEPEALAYIKAKYGAKKKSVRKGV
jgi:hypothetical protein